MFGINSEGEQVSINVEDYQPFFYVKVNDNWDKTIKKNFNAHIKLKVGKYYANSVTECILITRKKLYGFDNGKKHKFVKLTFANVQTFNKVKNLWYNDIRMPDGSSERRLKLGGYIFSNTNIELYEANIPPLLRFFHIKELSPSGWVQLPLNKCLRVLDIDKTTTCDYEYVIKYNNIIPLNDKECSVPYKKLSVDIEASSSHGDFPVPIKSYKKLATNIVDYVDKHGLTNNESGKTILFDIIKTAFGINKRVPNTDLDNIDIVYPKVILTELQITQKFDQWIKTKIRDCSNANDEQRIKDLFDRLNGMNDCEHASGCATLNEKDDDSDSEYDEDCDEECVEEYCDNMEHTLPSSSSDTSKHKELVIIDVICNKKIPREEKLTELIRTLRNYFPALEGDKITFIGSTLMRYGEKEPYLNHCIVLNTCDKLTIPNSVIETYETEREVLLAWTAFIQRENPDIIMGYNIFGFDYEFMFRRAQELKCVNEFLKLSKNKDEICANIDYRNGSELDIERSSTTLASGTYELSMIKMNGRLQIDLLNWFRRAENLTSYKLDFVGSYFIGDEVKSLMHNECDQLGKTTRVITKNMTGLEEHAYIKFEEIRHSSDYYKNGEKFRVVKVNKSEGWFEIQGHETPSATKVKWGLAKDDVSPKDIFRMTNEGPSARAVIAKYCIQDCNLVQYLCNKVDVITSLVEMSKLCSVPMSFLIFRGQGIKLTSYVAKKCREKGTLMPVLDKGSKDDGYEGAIVIKPKCALYLDEAVCIGDFASLYPSSMLSENLCPGSKLLTKTYNLNGDLINEIGEKDINGEFIYDNLPGQEYVDIPFDTYKWLKRSPKGRAEKVKSGHKMCRFAQPTINADGTEEKAIMPSILQELLKARKDTRKLIPKTSDEFMKSVLDARQLAYKVTANSLYGQLGAKTGTFYEPDIAAATTATGRLLLLFSKRVVEECYADTIITTKDGSVVHTNAESVYGDTDSVFFKFNLTDAKTGEKILGQRSLELSIEIAQLATHNVTKFLKKPHDFEYEKTFMPFCLLSKKRYVAIKYEFDPTKGKRNEMGIVLKRRDNAPIVKDIYGGVIDILMKEKDIVKAVNFVHTCLKELIKGNVPIEKLIITKSLRSFYKNPQGVAHKVLADRIGVREPGNKPTSGDRVPYVYFVNKQEKKGIKMLQGDKIESPAFITDNNLPINYGFYISNQIMNPLLQLFGLVLEEMWQLSKIRQLGKVATFKRQVESIKSELTDPTKIDAKINKLKDKEVKLLLFQKYLTKMDNIRDGNQEIDVFFGKKQKKSITV